MPRQQNFADFHVKRRIIKNCARIGHADQHPQFFVLIPVTPDPAQRVRRCRAKACGNSLRLLSRHNRSGNNGSACRRFCRREDEMRQGRRRKNRHLCAAFWKPVCFRHICPAHTDKFLHPPLPTRQSASALPAHNRGYRQKKPFKLSASSSILCENGVRRSLFPPPTTGTREIL